MSATDVIAPERLEALLRGEGPRTADERRRHALVGELRAAAVRTPEELRDRVLAAAPARRSLGTARPSRRLALAVVPAAVGLAVVAAIVHGFTGSGGGVTEHSAATGAKAPPSFGTTTVPAQQPFSAGTDSSRNDFQSAVPAATSAGALSGGTPTVGGNGRLQHTDASLEVRVDDVDHLSDATSAATRIATSLGGYAQSVVYRTPQGGGGASYLELRVPAQNVQRALSRLAQLGTLVSQQVSVEDLEHQLRAESEQIAQLRRRIAALRQALHDPALPDAQRVLLRIKLAESRRALSQQLNARKGTVAAGTTARVSVVLETKQAIVAVPHHRGRLGRMLHSAIGFLALEGTIALYALIVVAPLALVAALAWGFARARRRRDERRLLAA